MVPGVSGCFYEAFAVLVPGIPCSAENLIDLIQRIVRIVKHDLRGLLTHEPERVSQEAAVRSDSGACR